MSEVSANGYSSSTYPHKYTDILLPSGSVSGRHSSHMSNSGTRSSGMSQYLDVNQPHGGSSASILGLESKLGNMSLNGTGSNGLLHSSSSSPQLSQVSTSINNNHHQRTPYHGSSGNHYSSNHRHQNLHSSGAAARSMYHMQNQPANYLLNENNLSNGSNSRNTLNGSMASSISSHETNGGAGDQQHLSQFQRLMSQRPQILVHCHTGDSGRDTVLNQFRDVLHTLTLNPATFDEIVPYLVEALNCARVQPDTSLRLAQLLVTWSVAEENFRYTGAKLSNYLCLPEQLNFGFKNHFFSCVRSEVDKMDSLIKEQSQTNHQKLEGVILFISELYLNMGNVDFDAYGNVNVTRIKFLRNALKDAILKILELSPFDKPFLIVGRVLKLTGSALDESDQSENNGSSSKTERIYTHIEAIQHDTNTSQAVRSMYARVLQLRKSNWISDHHSYSISKDPTARHLALDTPVFFLDDGTPIPAHEADFIDSAAANGIGCGGDPAEVDFSFLMGSSGGSAVGGGGSANGPGAGGLMYDHSAAAGYSNGLANGISNAVHELTAEEDAAFELFLQQQQQL